MKVSGHGAGVLPQVVSNSTVKVSPSDNGKESLRNATHQLARDVYHKENSRETSPVYSKPINISGDMGTITSTKTLEEYSYESGLAFAHLYTSGGDVHKAAESMFSSYEQFMTELNRERPDLADSYWGISINKSGELEVSGSLSDDDKEFLETRLNENEELVSAAEDFKNNFLKYVSMESGGWGNYEVNDDNFAEIFDLKQMLDSSEGTEEFKYYWGKDFSFLELNENISSQLRSNASKFE
ncbi:hypothetical protein NJR55_00700 [Idiomarina sp. M1R2S28]|uniref:Uncharacterized protein n=1 Tax=Idiomarina rhizosphaerae TaxID=2961572 RepID=A0A9X2JQS7_9GAMM|nr:hypothetical protein [Idiomarina rhizosphaerae]MCP1338098.1 hypothetical protein [Idiomarina rhizosphaerae]